MFHVGEIIRKQPNKGKKKGKAGNTPPVERVEREPTKGESELCGFGRAAETNNTIQLDLTDLIDELAERTRSGQKPHNDWTLLKNGLKSEYDPESLMMLIKSVSEASSRSHLSQMISKLDNAIKDTKRVGTSAGKITDFRDQVGFDSSPYFLGSRSDSGFVRLRQEPFGSRTL
jgi:hypothetical protein